MLRDHQPIVISEFNGLWRRGDSDNTPIDHFSESNNIRHIGTSDFGTRPGIDISQDVAVPLSNVRRFYNYPTDDGNTLIALVIDGADGKIYHITNSTTATLILTITGMTDFAFIPYAGRGYISPFGTFTVTSLEGTLNQEKGLQNQFLYVYNGDGSAARKAAGAGLSGTMTVANGVAGHTDPGLHIFAFVVETDSGYVTAPGLMTAFSTGAALSVSFSSVDVSGLTSAVRRHLVATKVITNYNGNTEGYQFFFVPNATINDNTTTTLSNISFYDADLLDDASHLIDNFSEIPAGAVLTMYHDRLVLCTTFDDISIGLVSAKGEPEAISQIDGLFIVPLDGNPITNAQELRDVLYVTKRSRTVSFTDNDDEPASWPINTAIDTALGTCVHGIATVLDSGATNVDFLLVCTYQGLSLFNGKYVTPELTWKVEALWKAQDRNEFRKIQIVNAPIQKEIYIILPDRTLLVGNYANGMDPKKIRWEPWTFIMGVNTIAIVNIDDIILGSDLDF